MMKLKLGLGLLFSLLVSLSLNAANTYEDTLLELIAGGNLSAEKLSSPEWEKLAALVNANVAMTEHAKQAGIVERLVKNGIFVHSARPYPKDMTRAGRKTGFKKLDLVAFRVLANTQEQIADEFMKLENLVHSENGVIVQKPLWGGNPDIAWFAYVYFPAENTLAEVQIGNEFAFDTFVRDTELETYPLLRETKVDLWTNGFYGKVKAGLLQNGTSHDLYSDFLAIIAGKEEAQIGNALRNRVLNVIRSIPRH